MITSSVRIDSRIGVAGAALRVAVIAALFATGADIAEKTRENMYPGHFLDTGLSQDETNWAETGPAAGEVSIPTPYAAYPEFGTVHMAPRPALTPAIDECWPAKLIEHAHEEAATIRGLP